MWKTKTLKPEKVSSWPEATMATGGGARPSSDPVTTSTVFFTQKDFVSQTQRALSLDRLRECVPLLVDRSYVKKWRV